MKQKQVARQHQAGFFKAISDALERAVGEPSGRTIMPPKPSPDTVIEMQIKANRKRNRRAERNKRNHAAQQAGYYYAGVAEERREVRDAN